MDEIWEYAVPEPNSGCWLWAAQVKEKGYGRIKRGGRKLAAHRWSYERSVGPIPDGLFVCHSCDTPACVNPEHLFVGTHADNMQDAMSKGRIRARERHGRAKLTEAQVSVIRASGSSHADAGREYGVSRSTIYLIRRGINWKREHNPPPPTLAAL